jgi:septal ring factor EnvC (AmiA/AmiB activator)
VQVQAPVPVDPWSALENQFLRAECLSLGRKLKRALAKIDDLESSLVDMRGERDGARWVLDAAVEHIKELEGEHAAKKRVLEAVARAVDPSGFDEQQ